MIEDVFSSINPSWTVNGTIYDIQINIFCVSLTLNDGISNKITNGLLHCGTW